MRVDRRAGSVDLYGPLIAKGVKPVELATLAYGDIELVGNGEGGCPVSVGVEYKKLPDLIQSIDTGRLVGHQLPGMLQCYDQVWVLVEGIWRESSNGLVEVPRGGTWKPLRAGTGHFGAAALYGFLFTLQIKLGIRTMFTGTSSQTVAWLYQLNRWWTAKEWEDHRAHLAFDQSSALSAISRPSLVRRVAKELPGIGWNRSGDVDRHFSSVVEMVVADRADWEEIPGVGKGIAKAVVEALNGKQV